MKWYFVIVCVLFQTILSSWGDDSVRAELEARLREVDMARQAAEDRCLELNVAFLRTKKELEETRQQLADALLAAKSLQEDVRALNIKAANVLINHEDLKDAKIVDRLITERQAIYKAQQTLYQQMTEFKTTLDSVLQVVEPNKDSAFRQLLEKKYQLLLLQIEDAQLIANPESAGVVNQQQLECRILTVDDELKLAVLDHGQLQGAKVGSEWAVTSKDGLQTTLRLIESRPTVSAAMLISGDLRHVVPGATARRILKKPESGSKDND